MLDGTRRWLALLAVAGGLGQAAGPAAAETYWSVALDGTIETPLLRDFTMGPIRGPAGWEAWCADHPLECWRGQPATITLDARTVALLDRVFYAVDSRITAEDEPPGEDIWRIVTGEGYGDCEDYALTWREELVRAGLPRGALDIAVAETEQGEIHAVLAIHTDRGTLVFDNRHKTPKPWASLPYAWLALEPRTATLTPWHTLPDHARIGTTPTVTAEGQARR